MLCDNLVLKSEIEFNLCSPALGIFQLSRPMLSLTLVGSSILLHTNRIPGKKWSREEL